MARGSDRARQKWTTLHTILRCNMNPETQRVVVFVILLFLIFINVVLMFLLAFSWDHHRPGIVSPGTRFQIMRSACHCLTLSWSPWRCVWSQIITANTCALKTYHSQDGETSLHNCWEPESFFLHWHASIPYHEGFENIQLLATNFSRYLPWINYKMLLWALLWWVTECQP